MGQPYGYCDSLAKMIPFEVGMTLDKALEQDEGFKSRYSLEVDVAQLVDNAKRLEGLPRNAGKHAGGLVIAPQSITRYTPLYWEPGMNQPVTQFDKDDLEAIGLVKFDFLGLRTLTVIDRAMKDVNRIRKNRSLGNIRLEDLPLDDPKVYEAVSNGKTSALFQLESRGMQELIQRLKPDHFEELIALVALFRPGPLQSGMVDDFIDRKHGREKVRYPHPALEEILQPTYGVILYQEQVMEIARVLSGYTLGSADLLRRAMGKKKPEEMRDQRKAFIDGALERQVDIENAGYIFDLIEKFAGYGFNKSHSAAYALLSYQTAWLKTYYPTEFMAASLSADMEHTEKILVLVTESKRMGLKILPPDVNESDLAF
jgi:DNA polymerase-3 subunit alpha